MTCHISLSLPPGPDKGKLGKYLDDLDVALPQLAGHVDSLWMTDHFIWDDDPCYEAWTVMCYLAARWPQYRIGSIVLCQSYRNPALLAKMGATLQSLSGGRFIMGIGAGWKEDEYRAYDFDFPRAGIRVEQLQDTLEILTRMWREPGPVTWQGRHYRITEAICEPRPQPVPPIIVGAGERKTIRLAVQYADGWNPAVFELPLFRDRLTIFHQHCEELERDPAGIEISWCGRLSVAATERAAHERNNRSWEREDGFVGSPAQVIEQMQGFIDLGVSRFILEILEFSDEDVIGILKEDILPALR
ncbi:MAG: LLM class flavin-dependent oxidoreductase [Anaerolineaceae bacterium]|nr:LLM class flavin-dependent oxidoreductase [Anaerolineaceae bacterium]MDE0327999.1 LLM class flavin-dependent oxidoreductase [Anaerolineaceae bacterium]MDE0608542.1 LLM class flavin-dependent oxidoreductase [Anaerolineaceae bacterium]